MTATLDMGTGVRDVRLLPGRGQADLVAHRHWMPPPPPPPPALTLDARWSAGRRD